MDGILMFRYSVVPGLVPSQDYPVSFEGSLPVQSPLGGTWSLLGQINGLTLLLLTIIVGLFVYAIKAAAAERQREYTEAQRADDWARISRTVTVARRDFGVGL